MANQVERRTFVRWLLNHGFEEKTGKASGHRRFVHESSGLVVTVPGHGPSDLTKKHVGMILRSLSVAGFDPKQVRADLSSLS